MTKAEIVEKIVTMTGVNKKEALAVVESFMEVVKTSMIEKENVYLRGFGTFVVKRRAAKTGRNIQKNTTVMKKTQEAAPVMVAETEGAPVAPAEKPAKVEAPVVTVEEPKAGKKAASKKVVKVEKEEKKEAPAEAKKRGPKPKTEAQKAEDAKKREELKKTAANMVPEMFLQYQGGEVKLDTLVEKIKEAFKAEHKRTPIVSLKMYLKPEDNAVYYVINETSAGKVDM